MEKTIVQILEHEGVGVFPTDTIYGIVGSALSRKAVRRIYRLRRRNTKKPMIILIGSFDDLLMFKIKLEAKVKKALSTFWPGKVSIILPCPIKKFKYLHRGTNTLAFRLTAKKSLRKLIEKTGPLVAPSANFEGEPPAKTIREARAYFGDNVDFYIDGGKLNGRPSSLLRFMEGKVIVFR